MKRALVLLTFLALTSNSFASVECHLSHSHEQFETGVAYVGLTASKVENTANDIFGYQIKVKTNGDSNSEQLRIEVLKKERTVALVNSTVSADSTGTFLSVETKKNQFLYISCSKNF